MSDETEELEKMTARAEKAEATLARAKDEIEDAGRHALGQYREKRKLAAELVSLAYKLAQAEAELASHRAETADAAPERSGRLVMDEEISDSSPVIEGTWVTVTQVVSRVVDGWSWAEILRGYPELVEADIRACLDYDGSPVPAAEPVSSMPAFLRNPNLPELPPGTGSLTADLAVLLSRTMEDDEILAVLVSLDDDGKRDMTRRLQHELGIKPRRGNLDG